MHLKSVLQQDSYNRWMFKIPLNTARTSGVNASFSYGQRVSRRLTKCFRKQAVAPTTILLATSDNIWSIQRSANQGKEL